MRIRFPVLWLLCGALLYAQSGIVTNWYTYGGDSQRDGWEKGDSHFAKEDLAHFQVIWQEGLTAAGKEALFPPVILSKVLNSGATQELAFVAGSGNNFWAVDADAKKVLWSRNFDGKKAKPAKRGGACPAGLSAMPALSVRSLPAANMRSPITIYLLTGDGMLHRLNESDGSEMGAPIKLLRTHANAQALNLVDNFVYTSTAGECHGETNAVWAVDLSGARPRVRSFSLGDAGLGAGGVVLGSDGTVFARTGDGTFDAAHGKFSNSLLALSPVQLKLKQYFVFPGASEHATHKSAAATPVSFSYKGRELIVAPGEDGRLYVLDANSLGGSDHNRYLFRSDVLGDVRGGLTSWEEADGARYVVASVWGQLNPELREPLKNDDVWNGALAAFKMTWAENERPVLVPVWISGDIQSPAPPVFSNGVLFVLGNGGFARKGPWKETKATLLALDGETGRELYSTADQLVPPANGKGLSVANGRVYFETLDGTLQVYGKSRQPQLTSGVIANH